MIFIEQNTYHDRFMMIDFVMMYPESSESLDCMHGETMRDGIEGVAVREGIDGISMCDKSSKLVFLDIDVLNNCEDGSQ